MPEFQGEGNNITPEVHAVVMTVPPDLHVTSVTAVGPDPALPGHVLTGQNFTVTYTVTNFGTGDTPDRQSNWIDLIYLSRDQFLSDADFYFGSKDHTGGLKHGESYTNTATIKAPRGMSGPWYVFVLTDPPKYSNVRGDVFEANNEANNARPTDTPLLIDEPPPANLEVQVIR